MKFKKAYLSVFECEHKVFLILFAFYFIGFVYGLFFTSKSGGQALNEVFYENFWTLFLKNFSLIFLTFIFGYTPFGTPIIVFINCYNGICSGILSANIIISCGVKGALLISFLFYLYFLLIFISIVFVSFSSLRLSFVVFNMFRDENKYISANFYAKPHFLKFIFFTVLTVIATGYYIYVASPIIINFI